MHDGTTAGFNFRPGNNSLGYHWPGGAWWWDSGLIAPAGEWSHVAMVAEPNGITLYVNGRASKHVFNVPLVNFDSGNRIGNYQGWGGRFVKGSLDEVCVFNRALTQAEIRELMHLTKAPADQPNLISYYQFNEASGAALDRVGVRHGSLVGPTVKREKSTAPVGKGVSKRLDVVAGKKRFTFDGTGLTLVFPASGAYPNGEVVVSRLVVSPDTLPGSLFQASKGYWILQNYGSNANFVAPKEVWFSGIGAMPADLPASECKLWRRGPVAHGPNWQNLDAADVLQEGPQAKLGFTSNNQLKSAGQYWLELPGVVAPKPDSPLAPELPSFPKSTIQLPYPNPVAEGGMLNLPVSHASLHTLRLFDAKGNQVRVFRFEENTRVSLQDLSQGVYTYRLENGVEMRFGKLVVQ
jgi:hypothetical protein